MKTIALILTGLVAVEHIYILWLEMFAWETRGRKVFRGALRDELFKPTKVLAANQGLYNGFLAAGLIWSFFISDENWAKNIALFFLGCVAVAGLYGAATASKQILYVQAMPAILALLFWLLA
jgi:putative membrane protein